MSENQIPKDIMQSALDLCRTREFANDTQMAVARAILAERTRCADVAVAGCWRFENKDEYPASRVHDFVVVARAIERGIRNPKQ